MGIIELWETGFFHAIFNFATPFVSISFWVCLLIGCLIQFLINHKSQSKWIRASFVLILFCLILLFDVLCFVITGWDRLIYMYLEYCLIAICLGGSWMLVFHKLKKKIK